MSAFRATNNATQIVGSSGAQVLFQTEVFDLDGAFASSTFTVPAGWDGLYAVLAASVRYTSSNDQPYLIIERSTDGSTWEPVARKDTEFQSASANVVTGPLLMVEGHQYRVFLIDVFNAQIADDPRVFFGGFLTDGTPISTFRARANATQAISSSTLTGLTNLGTEVFDPDGVFSSSQFVVPSGWDGFYADLTAGVAIQNLRNFLLYIDVQASGGSTWDRVVTNEANSALALICNTGPILLTAGETYRAAVFCSLSMDLENDAATFFAGQIFDLS